MEPLQRDPWSFFTDQLSSSLTTDLGLLWSIVTSGLQNWTQTVDPLVNYLMQGTRAYENITTDGGQQA